MKQKSHYPLEEDRFQTDRVVAVSTGHAVHDTYTAFLPPLLPLFIANLSLSKAEAGLLTVFTQIPSLLQPVIGHLADRTHHQHLVFLAPAVTAALMSLVGEVPSYGILALLLSVAGLSSAAFHAVGPVIAGRLSGKSLGRGMSIWMLGGELGRTLGPIVVVTAIRFVTLDGLPWLMIVGFIVSLVLYARIRESHQRTAEHAPGLPWRRALQRMRPVMLPVIGLIVVRAFMFAALTVFLPTYLAEKGKSLWLAGASLTAVQAAGAVGALLGGTLSDKIGRRRILFVTLLITPVCMMIFLQIEGWLQFPLLMVMGLALISTTPVIMAVVQENFPENRALANGTYMCLSFVLRSVIVVAVGGIGDLFGLRNAFIVSSVMMFAGLPFILLLPKDRMKQDHRQDNQGMVSSMEV